VGVDGGGTGLGGAVGEWTEGKDREDRRRGGRISGAGVWISDMVGTERVTAMESSGLAQSSKTDRAAQRLEEGGWRRHVGERTCLPRGYMSPAFVRWLPMIFIFLSRCPPTAAPAP
jgi:hypothetical protein